MPSHFRPILIYIGVLGIAALAAYAIISSEGPLPSNNTPSQSAQAVSIKSRSPLLDLPAPVPRIEESSVPPIGEVEPAKTGAVVARITNPYPFPPEPFLAINERVRSALVNILCTTNAGMMRPISGSGILVDPRGVILTNAHVAQYVLLAQSGQVHLTCSVRSGAPARVVGIPEVLYLPPVWIQEHAKDIRESNPPGTGEHDYALLRIIDSPPTPSIPIDTREAIGFQNDPVLAAGYPAEFIGEHGALYDLYPISSVATIHELLTFRDGAVDLIALAGIIEAQSGASGGPIVNAWGYLVGIITTTSQGATTADRELHALTTGYIGRDFFAQSGSDLTTFLNGDIDALAENFKQKHAAALAKLLLNEVSGGTQ